MWDLWSHVGLELPQDISGMVTRCHIESSLSSLEIDFRDSFEASFHVFSGFGRRFFYLTWTIFSPDLIHYHLKYLTATSNLSAVSTQSISARSYSWKPIHVLTHALIRIPIETRSLARTPSKHTLAALASDQFNGCQGAVGPRLGPEEKYQVSSAI